jgi:hypothetical protein
MTLGSSDIAERALEFQSHTWPGADLRVIQAWLVLDELELLEGCWIEGVTERAVKVAAGELSDWLDEHHPAP